MRLVGPGNCRCREVTEIAMAALEGRELPPRNCPEHAPSVDQDGREARQAEHRAAIRADLSEAGREIAAARPPSEPPPSLRSIVAAAFGAAPEAERPAPPALNSDALLDSLKARLGIPDNDLPPAA